MSSYENEISSNFDESSVSHSYMQNIASIGTHLEIKSKEVYVIYDFYITGLLREQYACR